MLFVEGQLNNDDIEVEVGHGLVLPKFSLNNAANLVTLRSSACPVQEASVIVPDGFVPDLVTMSSNFNDNLSLALPHLEGLLVGERSSQASRWLVETQQQLHCLVRRAELFSGRSGRERFLEVVVFFNKELHVAVVFAPGAGGILLSYIDKLNNLPSVLTDGFETAAGMSIHMPQCVGCFSSCIDLADGDKNVSDSFGRPGANTARQETNTMKNVLSNLRDMSKFNVIYSLIGVGLFFNLHRPAAPGRFSFCSSSRVFKGTF